MSKVLILDFGSQFTQLITRRVRELHIYSEIQPFNYSFEKIKADNTISAIILSGGPNSIYDKNSPTIDARIFDLGLPVLGICYGLQLMGHLLGGKVEASNVREYGRAVFEPDLNHDLFQSLPSKKNINVWMSHGDHLIELPDGFKVIGSTVDCPYAAIANDRLKFYGFQYHPEVAHTQFGEVMIANFLFKIANIKPDWTPKSYIDNEIQNIKNIVGDKNVLCGLSGGVDSSVAAVLIHKAIGNQLQCMFVDNGLLRKNERDEVEKTFRENFKINLAVIDASDLFLNRLASITDPEQKRKIIGATFIEVFETESKKLGDFEFLAQGTLYPDVIESQSATGGPSHIIKSHHNVGGLPENMKFKLLEPLRELFKDEVREIGRELGISEEIVGRHPFPGPGLGIRIIGDITREKLEILQKADHIFIDELKHWKLQPSSNTDFLYESDESKIGLAHEDYRGSVHAIIYNKNIDKYLVIEDKTHLRSERDFYFAGGRAKDGETPKETLIREIHEETGLTYEDTNKMFYYGKIKQTYFLKASNGFPEKNRVQISDIYYVETDSIAEEFAEVPELKSKWVKWSDLEQNLLDGFKWVLLNCKANHSLYQQVWQAFCVLTEVKSIGVMGDGRTYENMLALRAVSASDGMTADWSRLPYEFLTKVSNRIINEVKGINRVAYDISSKPPATIEWE